MKKTFFILTTVVLVSVISNSCRQGCVCYADEYDPNLITVFDTRKDECSKLLETIPIDTITNTQFYTRCEWERY